MTYDYHEKIGLLTPSTEHKGYYVCPSCQKNKFEISDKGAKCWTGGCDPKNIREAIDKLEGKSEKWMKPIREKSKKVYSYRGRNGENLAEVHRHDDGDGGKKIWQEYFCGEPTKSWKKKKDTATAKQIPIYRYADIQKAIANDQQIFVVEGEKTADDLWDLGIPATTTIGGSAGYSKYGDYNEDLINARLVLCPDRDDAGLKYIANFAKDFNSQIEGYCLAGEVEAWSKPSDGRDLADDIELYATKESILSKVITVEQFNTITFSVKSEEVKVAKDSGKGSKNKSESRFSSSIEGGLILLDLGDDGNHKHDAEGNVLGCKVGSHLEAVAYIDSPEQDSAALLLEFGTARGSKRRWTMPRSELAGDGSEICRGLLSRGYLFDRSLKRHLLEYLQGLGSNIEKTYTVTESSGWVGKSFVLPHKTYGDENLKFRDVEASPESLTEVVGTLQEWIDRVAAMCAGNSRLILALGASFAAPLMPLINIESGGFHLVGATSQGKTTILSVAASVIGLKDIPHWRTTTNGLESTATAFNHLCLPLDEIGQADPKDVGSIAYMLANGQGKARMKKDLTNRKGKTWQLMVLSSGEVGLGDYMAQAKVTQKGGQEVRLPDIPAVPDGAAYGCFETIHGAADAVQFVNAIEAVVKANHGAVMDAFISRLVVDRADPNFEGNLSKQTHLIAKQLSESYTDSAIGRAAKRFALVQVALGLAHKYGLLPFSVNQISWAIEKVFMSWVSERGGDGAIEIKQALKKIDHLLTTNEFSKRIYDLRGTDNQDVENLLAYRKVDDADETLEFWVPTPVFDKEFCVGVNKDELIKALQATGRMIPPRPDGKPIHQRSKKGKTQYFYIFQNIEKAGEGSEGSEGNSYNQDNKRVPSLQGRLHQPQTNGEGSEGETDILHYLHRPITSGEGKIESCNAHQETVTGKASQPSPPSPQKTHIQETDEKNKKQEDEIIDYQGESI